MRLFVERGDAKALAFVQMWLRTQPFAQAGAYTEFRLPGGGERPIVISSAHGDELGKGPYSCSVQVGHPCIDHQQPAINSYALVVVNPNHPRLHQEIRGLLGQLKADSKEWRAPKGIKGRGGAVLYDELVYTGRIIRQPTDLPSHLPPNRYTSSAIGTNQPVVAYGTSDAVNVFELLQALKAGYILGLPVVFDQYESAHTVVDYWNRIAGPSFSLLTGITPTPRDLGLNPEGKFTQPMQPDAVYGTLRYGARLTTVATAWVESKGSTFAQWYRRAAALVAEKVLSLLEINVTFTIVTMESLLCQLSWWHWPTSRYGRHMYQWAGHHVGVLNLSDSERLTTRDRLPDYSLAEAHQQGAWLAGYPIYHFSYALGSGGGFIYLVKDGSKGEVHRLARPYLEDSSSGLYLLPANLFRIHAEGQHHNASIDPWVFLELLQRWGEERSRQYLRQIWDLIEIPLARKNIGRETRVALSLNGLTVQVTNP